MYKKQRTIAQAASLKGVGMHSGREVNLTIKPAPANHGIKFQRIDLPDKPVIPAHFSRVVDTSLATVIGDDGIIISTIEHLMAVFSGLGIDNALVELDAYELPIMDGSASPFACILQAAGIVKLDHPKYFFVIQEPLEIEKNGSFVGIYPAPQLQFTCTIDFEHPKVGRQSYSTKLNAQVFVNDIAKARTFGFLKDIEMLKMYGLAKGGALDNAVVLDQETILNPGGLRFENEFVRHKVLDCIGDFALLGIQFVGHIITYKSGHSLNHTFLQKVFDNKDAWQTCTFDQINSRVIN